MNDIAFTRGSGNIFADLELEDADELLVKSRLAWRIVQAIRDLGLSQADAAARYDVAQPRLSEVFNSRLDRFSLAWLIKLANTVGLNVTLTIEPVANGAPRGHTVVLLDQASMADDRESTASATG